MSTKLIDRFEFERVLWSQKIARVAGVDEAGRGPLAGPVVAAAAATGPASGPRPASSTPAPRAMPACQSGCSNSKELENLAGMEKENRFNRHPVML